jgi:hypothetical protein
MSLIDNEDLQSLRDSITGGMLDYMSDADVTFTKEDVDECRRILEEHLECLAKVQDRDSAMVCVKTTVLRLNALNEKAGGELIETDQREGICEYIIKAGALLDFNGEDEDVTEEWREW